MVAHRATRRKRASATQLYKTCKLSGTCPEDVINKVGQKTWADRILQWGSLFTYFGGLGIGTGSGSGGRAGYVPLGSRPSTIVDVTPARPPIVVESVGPTDPSIVTLVEESSVINSGAGVPNFTGSGGFEVTSSSTTTPAVLDITPTSSTVHVSSTTITNPLYIDPPVIEAPQTGEVSGNILISTPTSGIHSYEEIPMQTFAIHGTGNEPISSTPIPGFRRLAAPRLYSRAFQQVRVTDPAFLDNPTTLISADNPVFEGADTTLTFSPSGVAPDPDFMDIVALHRPAFTTRRTGVRFSRLGKKATMQTRRGTQIGARVHYYYDISPIAQADEIEMQPLLSTDNSFDGLYDIYANTDDEAPISFRQSGATPSAQLPIKPSTLSFASNTTNVTAPLGNVWETPFYSGPDIVLPTGPSTWPFVPQSPSDVTHDVYIQGATFALWPVYFFKRRRRKRIPYFFADGDVAA
uniref:Minor capsid protein L2 n=1 Tax=Human papillomavirus 66 TaxID=37119 RepID=A9XCW5_HPV66|nr:putative minor capsid protein L2 [human papillomavirus 66]